MRILVAILLFAPLMSGCFGSAEWDKPLTQTDFALPDDVTANLTAASITWPNFTGHTLSILDHGAFWACADAAVIFTNLTGAEVECTSEDDTGSALNRAIQGRGDPEFDVLYGIDNILMTKARDSRIFQHYTPQLADRVPADKLFMDDTLWPATPVDFGVIGLNIDSNGTALGEDGRNVTIDNLFKLRSNADLFVTQDPRTSTPGLGFMLTTIALFGENDTYDWRDYWTDLFEGDVLITSGWTEAYETHFTGGYGIYNEGHIGDRAIVTSYTNSPAYEAYYGGVPADVLLKHGAAPAVFEQIQTMGVLRGTTNRAIAEAWIEFTLTDDFQAMAAPLNAVYPVVPSVDTDAVYGDVDPQPGTFPVVDMSFTDVGANLERWLREWTALCEDHSCA